MYKRLASWSCPRCVAAGRHIRVRLDADPLLSEVAAEFGRAQDAFEARVTAWAEADKVLGAQVPVYQTAGRGLEDRLREFGLALLSVTRNHHDADPYVGYYPRGYGEATHLDFSGLLEYADLLGAKLAQETDAWLLSFRERIQVARDAFAAAQEQYLACVRAEREAIAFRENEKRRWVAAVSAARHKADAIYFWDPARVRAHFSSVAAAPSRGHAGEPEPPEGSVPAAPAAAAPAAPGAPLASVPSGSSGSAPGPPGAPTGGATPPTSA